MSANSYKRALRVLEKWPLDPYKGSERDFGALLRKRVAANFPKGEQSQISDPQKCNEMLTSLENLCAEKYCKQYPTSPELKIGALKIEIEDCQYINSEDTQNELKEQESSGPVSWFYNKLKRN